MKIIKLLLICILFIPFAFADSNKKESPKKNQLTASLAKVAENIRNGKIDVGKHYSMDFKTGRFHIIHADKMLIDCKNCHYGKEYKTDYQVMGKHKPMPDKMPGRLQRGVCLGCHSEGGIATAWYGRTAKW